MEICRSLHDDVRRPEQTTDAYPAQFPTRLQHQFPLPQNVDFLSVKSPCLRVLRGQQLPQGYVEIIQRGVNRRYLRFQFRDDFRQ